jgi:hypothetical protein
MRHSGYDVVQEATGRKVVNETSGYPCEGQQMQAFELPDPEGQPFELHSRLQEKPLILVLYRGDW